MGSTMLGSVVGPILDIPAGASGAQNTGRGYDVALGDLFFNVAPTDQNPYQRATAQFRKDQFDSAQNPGDQSLTGWWKRGQFSFDHGAGIKYYEVSAGETVLNRYQDSEGVDPFTAGVVNLYNGWTAGVTGWSLSDLTNVAVAGTTVAALGGGVVKYGSLGGGATTYSPSSAVKAICTGNGDIYCALADKTISRIGLNETRAPVYSADFEVSIGTWAGNTLLGTASLPTSVVRSTARPYEGVGHARITWAAPGSPTTQFAGDQVTGLTVGKTYTLVAKVYVPTGSGTIVPSIPFNTSGAAVAVFDAYTTVVLSFTATSTTHFIGFKNTAPVGGTVLDVDKVFVYDGVVTDYTTTGTAPTDVLYTHSADISNLFFAKDRLLMVDANNTWYELPANPSGTWPVATTAGDKVFTVTGASNWCLTDSPGPILIATGTRVFAVSAGSDGTLPTLSGPIQVAELPTGETVRAMTNHLGFLALATDKGIRLGILSDSGQLTYGPRLMDFSTVPVNTSIGKDGERVIVAADRKVYDVDLANQITGLEFAYAKRVTPYSGGETNYGIAVHPTGVLAWSDTAIYKPSTSLGSGYLTTGYHRFATLDPKRFEAVDVRISGTEGTVAVARVDQSGSVVPLYTIDASASNRADIGLSLTAPVEAVALKFTLTAGAGGTGPTLLGYQLRALPQPKRQRLLRIPLLIDDQERRRPARTTGHLNYAWTRLKQLEDLEDAGTGVLYKDFRTGETANVYVESVEFNNTTPPSSAQSSGFGGIAWLTVRKLA